MISASAVRNLFNRNTNYSPVTYLDTAMLNPYSAVRGSQKVVPIYQAPSSDSREITEGDRQLESYEPSINAPANQDTKSKNSPGHKSRTATLSILLGIAALAEGCASYLDVKSRFESLPNGANNPKSNYTMSFEVGKHKKGFERVYDTFTPWNRFFIDQAYYSNFWEGADKAICDKKGLLKAAQNALSNGDGLTPENQQLASDLNKAACEDYSQTRLSGLLRQMQPEQRLALAKGLESKIESDPELLEGVYWGAYKLIDVEVDAKDKLHPTVRFVMRRALDGAIITATVFGVSAAVGANGAVEALIPPVTVPGPF